MMSQNIQSSKEQTVKSIQYTIAETILQMNLRGTQGEKLHESHGGLSESSPLRSDGSGDSQTGGLAA